LDDVLGAGISYDAAVGVLDVGGWVASLFVGPQVAEAAVAELAIPLSVVGTFVDLGCRIPPDEPDEDPELSQAHAEDPEWTHGANDVATTSGMVYCEPSCPNGGTGTNVVQ